MVQKKAAGSTRNGRDSNAKRLGVKVFGGQKVSAGSIILRQRGTKMRPGENVGLGKDHTIFALIPGEVFFTKKKTLRYDGRRIESTIVHVKPVPVEGK